MRIVAKEAARKYAKGRKIEALDYGLVKKYQLTQKQQKMLLSWFQNDCNQVTAFKSAFPEWCEGRKESVISGAASNLMNSTRIQSYLQEQHLKTAIDPETDEAYITIPELVKNLADIAKNEENKAGDRIKASEVLLKHLNGFEAHNSSRAPKMLTYISNQSDTDLLNEIHTLSQELLGAPTNFNNNENSSGEDYIEAEEIDIEEIDD
jgi:hypothetical protein